MSHIKEQELDRIKGGDSSYVSGPIISSIVSIIKLVRDAGYDLGSGFRRMAEDEVCPLR